MKRRSFFKSFAGAAIGALFIGQKELTQIQPEEDEYDQVECNTAESCLVIGNNGNYGIGAATTSVELDIGNSHFPF